MLVYRPLRVLAAILGASGLLLATSAAVMAQRPMYRNVSHGQACPCPCPCPEESSDEAVPTPGDEEDLPEVADLSAESSLASAPQSAAPNAIGDSIAGFYATFGNSSVVAPGGGYRYRTSINNSAIPQDRVYYAYNYFNNVAGLGGDLQRHMVGVEKTFGCGCSSIGVQMPTFDDGNNFDLGDLGIYTKTVIMQDCCNTVSTGVGVLVPTAQDDLLGNSTITNDAWIISPYLATYTADPCSSMFFQSFAQVDIPLGDNNVYTGGVNNGTLQDATLLYLDGSIGYWLSQDCCGNGIAAIAELHYTRVLDDDVNVPTGIQVLDQSQLNATAGASIINGCWSVTPAVVVPLLDTPDRGFDWEAQVFVNRRF